ncbi:MAG: hypothetical protein WCV55_00735 [Candidatus Paceibacterota bacterium]
MLKKLMRIKTCSRRKKIIIIIGIIFFVILIVLIPKKESTKDYTLISNDDFKNTSYSIEGQVVTLQNGLAETEILPGSASKKTTKYFGNELKTDLDGDGLQDVAFLLTQNSSGSGTFYYVVVALNTKDGYVGTNAILLGDRIAPQTTEFKDGKIVVNFAERLPNEPMTAKLSRGVSKYFQVQDNKLISVTN